MRRSHYAALASMGLIASGIGFSSGGGYRGFFERDVRPLPLGLWDDVDERYRNLAKRRTSSGDRKRRRAKLLAWRGQ